MLTLDIGKTLISGCFNCPYNWEEVLDKAKEVVTWQK